MSAAVPIHDQFVVSIGEILWDVAGNQRHIGGAPFNFAYHCKTLGAKSALISRVSLDELGKDIVDRATKLNVDTRGIQASAEYPTGVVTAETHLDGSVSYILPTECAWDHIRFTDASRSLIDFASVIYFGTLAQRAPVSRSAIRAAIAGAPVNALCFLDVNLRPPCYSHEILSPSLKAAHIVKMNEQELAEIRGMYDLEKEEHAAVHQLIEQFEISTVVLTRGADGATAWDKHTSASVAAPDIKVPDTIGCGDAFSAAFTMNLAAGSSLKEALESANNIGAYVATQHGATPAYDAQTLQKFRNDNLFPG